MSQMCLFFLVNSMNNDGDILKEALLIDSNMFVGKYFLQLTFLKHVAAFKYINSQMMLRKYLKDCTPRVSSFKRHKRT